MVLVSVGHPIETDEVKYAYAQEVRVWKGGYDWRVGNLCKRKSCEMLDFVANKHYLPEADWKRSFRSLENATPWLRKRLVKRYWHDPSDE